MDLEQRIYDAFWKKGNLSSAFSRKDILFPLERLALKLGWLPLYITHRHNCRHPACMTLYAHWTLFSKIWTVLKARFERWIPYKVSPSRGFWRYFCCRTLTAFHISICAGRFFEAGYCRSFTALATLCIAAIIYFSLNGCEMSSCHTGDGQYLFESVNIEF